MNFTESVKTCFNKYAEFKGKASKSEFWWWILFTVIAQICLGVISNSLALAFSLATLLPTVAAASRRLHDTGRSGWWQLIGIIPIIGWILTIVWLCEDSKEPAQTGMTS